MRAEALQKVATDSSGLSELQNNSDAALKQWFEQDALVHPVETILEKSQQRDYQFFLASKNFVKVADSLEKVSKAVDPSTQEGRDFLQFKRKLYELYEVQNRSLSEHEEFSFNISREEVGTMYNANLDHLEEMRVQRAQEYLAD